MDESSKKHKLLQTGAEVFGAAVGGAIGLIGGPGGAIGGGMAGVIVSKGLIEFADKFLSHREQARVGAAAGLTIVGIQDRIQSGQQLRQDSFFEPDDIYRSKAEELFEGILIKCKNEYEEKKIKYITKIYENVAFDTNISPITANQILSVAEGLTYRKLCILAFYGIKDDEYDTSTLVTEPYSTYQDKPFLPELEVLIQDIFELINQGLLSNNKTAVFDVIVRNDQIVPSQFSLTDIGKVYFNVLGLFEIDRKEISFVYEELKYRNELGLSDFAKANGKSAG